jgi:hypothetical protein
VPWLIRGWVFLAIAGLLVGGSLIALQAHAAKERTRAAEARRPAFTAFYAKWQALFAAGDFADAYRLTTGAYRAEVSLEDFQRLYADPDSWPPTLTDSCTIKPWRDGDAKRDIWLFVPHWEKDGSISYGDGFPISTEDGELHIDPNPIYHSQISLFF